MIIKARPKDLYLFVEDDAGRVIYQITCYNQVHYEMVKLFLIKIREGKKVEEKLLKPLSS